MAGKAKTPRAVVSFANDYDEAISVGAWVRATEVLLRAQARIRQIEKIGINSVLPAGCTEGSFSNVDRKQMGAEG